MVRNDTDRDVRVLIFFVFDAGDLADPVAQGLDRVDVKHGIHVLNRHGQTLEPHARVDVFLFQGRVIAFAVIFKLREDIVPYLHVAVAVTAGSAVFLPAAVFFAAVVIDFRAGAAGTCAVLPEIVFFSEAVNALRRNSDFLIPDLIRFVVIQVDGRIETVRIKADGLRQEFPGPVDGFGLKIITKGEITKHLKKCAVAGGMADIFNISRADAFLAGSDSLSGRYLCACKIRLQRRHASVDEEDGIVPVRHE